MEDSFGSPRPSGNSPTCLDNSHDSNFGTEAPSSPASPRPKGSLTQGAMSPNQCHTVILFAVPIAAIYIDGKERLCLAQISNTLLKRFSYNEIHNRRVALGVTCVQCTPVQLEMLRRAGAMPVSSRRCGMITKREAERLCKSFLFENQPPKLPDNFAFDIYHDCAWGCRGDFVPSRYNSSRAKCIKCVYCGLYFSPNKFIFHTHRIAESKYRYPDAANFNSWRRHINLVDRSPTEDLLQAWEDVKAMFNGGSRKRSNSSSTSPTSPSSCSSASLHSSDSLPSSPPATKRKRASYPFPEPDSDAPVRPTSMDLFSAVTMGGANIHTPQPNRPGSPKSSLDDNTAFAAAQLYASSAAKLRQQFSAHAMANRNLYAEYLSSGGKLPYPLNASFWPKTPGLMPRFPTQFPKEIPGLDLNGLNHQRPPTLKNDSLTLQDDEGTFGEDEALRDFESWEKARFPRAETRFNLRDMNIPGKAEFQYGSAFRPVLNSGVDITDSAMALRAHSAVAESSAQNDASFLHRSMARKQQPNLDPSSSDVFRIADAFPGRDSNPTRAMAGIPAAARHMDFARYFMQDDKSWSRDLRDGTAFTWRQHRERRFDDLLFRVARKECERKTKGGAGETARDAKLNAAAAAAVIQDSEASTSCGSPDTKQENAHQGASGAPSDFEISRPEDTAAHSPLDSPIINFSTTMPITGLDLSMTSSGENGGSLSDGRD